VACGQSAPEEEEPPVETEAPETPEPIEPEPEMPELRLPGDTIAGIGRYEVIFELDDMPLLWEEMYHYLQSTRRMLESVMVIEDWDADSEELDADGEPMTFNEILIHNAIENALQHRAVQWLFNDLGETLEEDHYQETKAEYMEAFGMSEEEFLAMLWENYLTEGTFAYIFSVLAMRDQAMIALYGEQGEAVPAEAIDAFVEEHEVLRAKHILLSIRDENNQDLPEAEQAEVRAAADAIFEEVTALQGDARLTLFDELIIEVGEDPGMFSNPEGYVFMEGVMVPEFFDGTRALAYGEISPPIRSGFGYHIILRLPVEGDQEVMQPGMQPGAPPETVQRMAAISHMRELLEEIKEELQAQYRTTPLFDRIVPGEIFAAAE